MFSSEHKTSASIAAGIGSSWSPHIEHPRAAPMRIQDNDREYLISIDGRDLDGDLVWYTFDDGFLTIGCGTPEGTAIASAWHRCQRTFLLLDRIDGAAIRTERCGEAMLLHLPKSPGGSPAAPLRR